MLVLSSLSPFYPAWDPSSGEGTAQSYPRSFHISEHHLGISCVATQKSVSMVILNLTKLIKWTIVPRDWLLLLVSKIELNYL